MASLASAAATATTFHRGGLLARGALHNIERMAAAAAIRGTPAAVLCFAHSPVTAAEEKSTQQVKWTNVLLDGITYYFS